MNEDIIIYIIGLLAISSAFFLFITSNILHAAYSLGLILFCVAIIYVLNKAHFLAGTQLLIYIGGIVLLILFGLMMTQNYSNTSKRTEKHNMFSGMILSSFILTILIISALRMDFKISTTELIHNDIKTFGFGFMTTHLLLFELSALLLLLVLLGLMVVLNMDKKN